MTDDTMKPEDNGADQVEGNDNDVQKKEESEVEVTSTQSQEDVGDTSVDPLEAAVASAEDEQVPVIKAPNESEYLDTQKQNVTIEKDVEIGEPESYKRDVNLNVGQVMSIPRLLPDEVDRLSEAIAQYQHTSSPEVDRWYRYIQATNLTSMNHNDELRPSLSAEGSDWRQVVEFQGRRLSIGRPEFGDTGGDKLTGDRALYRVLGMTGLGSVVQVPLWHSGIWLSLRAPSDSDFLLLQQKLAEVTTELGHETMGMIFSGDSSYLIRDMMDFVINYVYDCTLKDYTADTLKEVILSTDIPTILWAMGCTIYPNGFPYSRPCMSDPTSCTHVDHTTLNLNRISWTNINSLTDKQLRHMINRSSKHTIETVKDYQAEHKYNNGSGATSKITISDNLSLYLKVPNIAEYIESGSEWVGAIIKMIDSYVTTDSDKERNNRIDEMAASSSLRQYSHWVERMTVDHDGNQSYIEGNDLLKILEALSSDSTISDKFFDGIRNHINNTTISIIGVPRYRCTNCGKPQGDDTQSDSFIIPVDAISVFSILRRRRLARATK